METKSTVGAQGCLYLYGIIRSCPLDLAGVKDIEGGSDLFLVSWKELACAVSPVPVAEYSEQSLTARTEELDWVAPRAVRHQDVVQHLRRATTVIPLKFGTLCSSEEKVREILQEQYELLLRSLDFLTGREEWGVKVCVVEDLTKQAMERADPQAGQISELMSSVSEGEAYFLRKKKRDRASQQRDQYLYELGEEAYRRLLACARAGRRGSSLNPAPRSEQVPILNAAFLIDEQQAAGFETATGRLEADYRNLGMRIELSGPWAPYSFCGDPAKASWGQDPGQCGG